MTRIFGFAVGLIWLGFAFMAFRAASAGATADRPDQALWFGVVTFLLALSAVIALVGTVRHRASGPRK